MPEQALEQLEISPDAEAGVEADEAPLIVVPDIYYVEERGKRRFSTADFYSALQKSREYDSSAKVRRESDGALLAYRTRMALTPADIEQDRGQKRDEDDES